MWTWRLILAVLCEDPNHRSCPRIFSPCGCCPPQDLLVLHEYGEQTKGQSWSQESRLGLIKTQHCCDSSKSWFPEVRSSWFLWKGHFEKCWLPSRHNTTVSGAAPGGAEGLPSTVMHPKCSCLSDVVFINHYNANRRPPSCKILDQKRCFRKWE